MYSSSRNGFVRWLMVSALWLGVVSLVLAQQPAPPPSAAKKTVGVKRPRRVLPTPNPNRAAYSKKGTPRKLSPDQLWELQADSTHPQRGLFRLLVYTGLGASIYSAPIPTPGTLSDEQKIRLGAPVSLRVMWQTDHRLRMGVETGYVNMYRYRGFVQDQPAQVRVSAIPMLAVFSMSVVKRFALYAGTGPYLINSHLNYDGLTRGSTFSLGWMVAGTYTQPISKNLGLAAELKWYDATQTEDACFIAQATLVWRALTW